MNGEAPKGFTPGLELRPTTVVPSAPSGTGLIVPCLMAFVGAALLMGAWTSWDYFKIKSRYEAEQAAAANKPAPAPEAPTPAPEDPAKKPAPSPADPGKAPTTTAKGKDINDVLGESGTKTAKPGVNPLDNKGDDLLKDIK